MHGRQKCNTYQNILGAEYQFTTQDTLETT